jgi:hypothetical protein
VHPAAVATAAIIVLRILSAALQPRRFASPGERRVDGAIRCRQLQPIAVWRTSTTDAFSASRMRTPRGPSRTLWSLHRTVSTSDIPVVTGRHTRVEILFARCAVHSAACIAHFRAPCSGCRGVDLLVRGPGFALVVFPPGRAKARERLLSYWELASFHPRAAHFENLYSLLYAPAPFRLLSIRARTSGDAADFLLASALFCHQPILRSTGEESARCVQPTSATQTKTCTRTSCVPDSLRSFRCVDAPRRLRLRATLGDSKVSRPSRSLRRTVPFTDLEL